MSKVKLKLGCCRSNRFEIVDVRVLHVNVEIFGIGVIFFLFFSRYEIHKNFPGAKVRPMILLEIVATVSHRSCGFVNKLSDRKIINICPVTRDGLHLAIQALNYLSSQRVKKMVTGF